jgi:uncharacterized protein (DUF697 family)
MAIPPQLLQIGKAFTAKVATYLTSDYSTATLEERQKYAAEVRQIAAVSGLGIAPLPIPFADIWTITPIQVAMVQAIGNIYGFKLEGKNLKAVFGTVAGGWLGQQACLALFKIGMPVAGGFGGAAFVWVWTHAMGKVAERYFASGMTLSKKELDEIRKSEVKNSKPAPPTSSDA